MTRRYFDANNTVVDTDSDQRQNEGYYLDSGNIIRKVEKSREDSQNEALADISSIQRLKTFMDSRKVSASASFLGLSVK